MKNLLLSTALLLLLSFYSQAQKNPELPSDWKLISGCTVSVYAPSDIEFKEDNSSDTCLREYQGKSISMMIYVTPFNIGSDEYSNWLEYCVLKTEIQTRKAEIVTSYIPVNSGRNDGLDFTAMLLVPQFRTGDGNLIIRVWGKTPENRDRGIKILESAQFDMK